MVDDAEDDGSALGVRERADELRDGRCRRQHRLVFEELGFGLADASESFGSDNHGLNWEPSNLCRLQDVAERDPPDLRAGIDPELIVFVVQHVSVLTDSR